MTPLTALDVPGEVYSFEGEIDSQYVHQYKTTRYPELDGKEIEEQFERFEEVIKVEISDASENNPQ